MSEPKLLVFCLPLYDGKVCWETWFQIRQEEELFRQLPEFGWRTDIIVVAGSSLIARSRNEAVWNALHNRNADAVMWVDGDMNWTSGAVIRMLSHDVDICAAAVPKKEAEISWNVRFLPDRTPNEKGLIEVDTVGTGFMLTKRRVYEIMAERTHWDGQNTYDPPNGEGGDKRKAYFQAPGSWGEDTFFCHAWRNLGGKIYVDPAITMQHVIAPKWSVKACLGEWLDVQKALQEKEAA
jgi:hypothetical protein